MTSKVHVAGDVRVDRALLTRDEIEEDRLALSVPNPERVAALRRGDPRARFLPDRVSMLREDERAIAYPWAAPHVYLPRLRGRVYELVDERPRFAGGPIEYRGELLPFQERLVDTLAREVCGVGVAPCGTGKGEAIVALTGRLGVPALIVVPQIDHATDLQERVRARLGVECGIVGGGSHDVERITVAVAASLTEERLAELRDRFEVLIVDEAHHSAAESYRRALSQIAARRKYGVTATLVRQDGLTPFVHHSLGPVRCEVTRAELESAGRSLTPVRVAVPTSFVYEYRDRDDWAPLCAALAEDTARNELIASTVAEECKDGALGAAITSRVEHANDLARRIGDRGLRVAVLTGKTPKKRRAEILRDARAGELDVLVGSNVLDEGIDVAPLARVFLCSPAKAEGRIVQRVGRALRVHKGKSRPRVLDFCDERVGVLAHQARIRARVFRTNFEGTAA